MKVTNAFHDIIISTAELDAGTYYYQLQTASGFKAGKKMVVVKQKLIIIKTIDMEPYYVKYSIVDQTLLFTSALAVGYIFIDAEKYSEVIRKLEILDFGKLDTLLYKIKESKLNQPFLLSLEEEIMVYTNLHLAAAYTTTDLFLKFVNEKTGQKKEIIPWKKKRAKDSFYKAYKEVMDDIDLKLWDKPEYIERKKLLDTNIPLDKLHALDFLSDI